MSTEAIPCYDQSRQEHARREKVIAGGVNSNVRLHGTPVPLTMVRGDGALLWDVDDNVYIDYAAGMGPVVLGHNHPAVTAAVQQSLSTGQLFAGQHPLEAEFAETLVGALPWIESIRMGMSGTEMDLLAVRIARATTGRRKVVRFTGHYHGWLDPLFVDMAVTAPPMGPVPLTAGQSISAATDVILCEWNDTAQVAQALESGDVACVLMEPVMCNTGLIPPSAGYLDDVKTLCHQHGALFVVDEVITGFRLGLCGAQGFYGIRGDISIYAKAIASGFPLAVLGTSAELLAGVGRGEVNHSGTYNTGVSSVAAGVATLRVLIDSDPYPEMDRLTCRLVDGLRQLDHELSVGLAVDHIGGSLCQTRFGKPGAVASRADFAANSDNELLACFLASLQDHGVRPTSRGLWFVSAAHDDALIDKTLAAARHALSRL
ncbi:aspartate aminotransferase family protein [Candidatus Poriferisodalis sp.]|uniref:aspartate aminotransferase family protein n=1 Tax=Candidatus Poriferisodalis sp. TaxID=3101277 RepID=UPI003B02BCEF